MGSIDRLVVHSYTPEVFSGTDASAVLLFPAILYTLIMSLPSFHRRLALKPLGMILGYGLLCGRGGLTPTPHPGKDSGTSLRVGGGVPC